MAVHLDHRLQWALPAPQEVWAPEARWDHRRHLVEVAHLWVVLLSHLHLEEVAHRWVVLLSHLHLEEAAHRLLVVLHLEALEWALDVPHLLLLGLLPNADSCSKLPRARRRVNTHQVTQKRHQQQAPESKRYVHF